MKDKIYLDVGVLFAVLLKAKKNLLVGFNYAHSFFSNVHIVANWTIHIFYTQHYKQMMIEKV